MDKKNENLFRSFKKSIKLFEYSLIILHIICNKSFELNLSIFLFLINLKLKFKSSSILKELLLFFGNSS